MSRIKITEIGKLNFLDDGGLVRSVTSDQPPSIESSALIAAFCWTLPDASELAIGDLVAHLYHGVARYCGHRSIAQVTGGSDDCLVLEYAHGVRLYVPVSRLDSVRKLGKADYQLSKLNSKGKDKLGYVP
jgi:transcription-repair coupling factor (superfamily II helicase)